ncbi:MAG: hypothetical protein R2701_03390 [Acidimicrobiales bacterium]
MIAMVGRIAAWKGHRVLLDAVHSSTAPMSRCSWWASRRAPTGRWSWSSCTSVRELGLEERVLFTGPVATCPTSWRWPTSPCTARWSRSRSGG